MNVSITETISKLEYIFEEANKYFYNNELVKPMITVQTSNFKKAVLGWCSVGHRWVNEETNEGYYEINIVAENLSRPIEDIVETMLHEMVHLYNQQHGISDCNRAQYHNKKFKAIADTHGLTTPDEVSYRGFSLTKLSETGKEFVQTLDVQKLVFNRGVLSGTPKPIRMPNKNLFRYRCNCGIQFKNASSDLDIMCCTCSSKFVILNKR